MEDCLSAAKILALSGLKVGPPWSSVFTPRKPLFLLKLDCRLGVQRTLHRTRCKYKHDTRHREMTRPQAGQGMLSYHLSSKVLKPTEN